MLALLAQARIIINCKRLLGERERTVNSRFEVRSSKFETMQYLLVLKVKTVRKTVNSKRLLGERESMDNSYACRLDAEQ
ncbi:MAG: hypothetical protein FWC60_02530 [Firmicutes bacterium]|nr:hypothetical protein [Bacillota bacterium]